ARNVSATQGATVFCGGFKTSHDLAVFANGVMIRYLDFNDGYITPKGGGHPSDTLASLISTADVAGRSGRDLITATALAYEAFCSAQLAQAGMTGPAQVFEGPSGFFNTISHKPFELPKLGEPYGIMRAFTKRFPLGQYSQTVAEAAAQARALFKSVDEIAEI